MPNLRSKPAVTLEDLKTKRGFPVAKTLMKQADIFNCSLEVAWEKYIHRAVHNAHKKEDVFSLIEQIKLLERLGPDAPVEEPARIGYECFIEEKGLLIQVTLVETARYRLEIFKNQSMIYRHPSLIVYPFDGIVPSILRNEFSIRKVKLRWSKI